MEQELKKIKVLKDKKGDEATRFKLLFLLCSAVSIYGVTKLAPRTRGVPKGPGRRLTRDDVLEGQKKRREGLAILKEQEKLRREGTTPIENID